MKKIIISLLLILALTNQAYAMGWLGGGGGGGSSAGAGSGGKANSNTPSNANSNSTTNPSNNSPAFGSTGRAGSYGTVAGSSDIEMSFVFNSPSGPTVSTPEPTTLFLLGSALLGLWSLRRRFKK
jgi:hypothetical protein